MQLADLGMKDLKAVTNLLEDHITIMEKRHNAPGYIHDVKTAVQSWLEHFDLKITRRIRISDPSSTPTLENEKVPEASEIAEMFNRADLRTAAAESLIAN